MQHEYLNFSMHASKQIVNNKAIFLECKKTEPQINIEQAEAIQLIGSITDYSQLCIVQ